MSRIEGHSGNAGHSILELLWEELDDNLAEYMRLGATYKSADAGVKLSGVCLGLATAIAILNNPYEPNVNAVREEAMSRLK